MPPAVVRRGHMGGSDPLTRGPSDRTAAIGTATSVRDDLWRSARFIPSQSRQTHTLTDKQRSMLQLFSR